MKKKFISIALLSVALLGAGAAATSTPVQAISKKQAVTLRQGNYSYRKVRLTKTTYIRRIHYKYPLYKSTVGPRIKLKSGRIVRIQQTGTNFGWYMHVPGWKGTYTIVKKYNDYSWFSLDLHPHKKKTTKKTKVSTSSNNAHEYVDSKDSYHNNGVIMERPTRFDFTSANKWANKWGDDAYGNPAYEHYVGFVTTLTNNSKHTINAAQFLQKHLQLLDGSNNIYPISNNINRSDYHIGTFDHGGVPITDDMNEVHGKYWNWATYLSNFSKNVKPKHKLVVLFVHWVPNEKQQSKYFFLKIFSSNGKQLKYLLYPHYLNVIN